MFSDCYSSRRDRTKNLKEDEEIFDQNNAAAAVSINEPDSELERSLTTEWDVQVIEYPNKQFPFNE